MQGRQGVEEEWFEGAEHPEVRVHRVQWTQRWGGMGEEAHGSRDMREGRGGEMPGTPRMKGVRSSSRLRCFEAGWGQE